MALKRFRRNAGCEKRPKKGGELAGRSRRVVTREYLDGGELNNMFSLVKQHGEIFK